MNPPSLPQTRIGIDLDNTLIRYDAAFHACARQLKWITPDVAPTKQAIRDHLRTLPDGEHRWTELQSRVYGPQILSADLAPGADRFLRLCHVNRIPVVIVSHKSRRAAFDPSIDLHAAAQRWLGRFIYAHAASFGIEPSHVYLEPTREAKAARIVALACTHWIDDLPEFYESTSLPTGITRILYAPHGAASPPAGLRIMARWNEITSHFVSENGWTPAPETSSPAG